MYTLIIVLLSIALLRYLYLYTEKVHTHTLWCEVTLIVEGLVFLNVHDIKNITSRASYHTLPLEEVEQLFKESGLVFNETVRKYSMRCYVQRNRTFHKIRIVEMKDASTL